MKEDEARTREHLEGEMKILRLRVAELEKAEADRDLSEGEVQFRGLFDTMSSGVAVYSEVDDGEDFIFEDINPAGERIESVRKEDIIGKRVTEVFPGVKDFGIFKVFQRVWKTGVSEFFPQAMYSNDRDPGTWRENHVYKLPSGEVVAVYDDVTVRKRAEEKLKAANQQLNASNQQLKASEQQLKSSNQQLDASNQQLMASEQQLKAANQDLKERENKLIIAEETYRNLFQNAQVGLFRTRIEDGKMLESNEQLSKMFGCDDREEFIDEYFTSENYVDPGTREKMVKEIKTTGKVNNFEVRFYRKDGSIFWARYSARINPDKGWIEGVGEDITDRKQAEEKLKATNRQLDAQNQQLQASEQQLRASQKEIQKKAHDLEESEERLKLAMDAGEHGFWDWNLETDDIYFSPRYYTMLGYEPGELPMVKDTWTGLMHPEDRKTIVPKVQKYVENAEPYEVEFRLKCKDGSWKWISGRGKSFEIDENGKPRRAVG
ncbi:MAG: PAS domain-containing protein, partial [Candidatus Thermoplasmatota archaeon]|nr:PAS domain-containing protein [Candidatus Thermoplasmatota archaeon]